MTNAPTAVVLVSGQFFFSLWSRTNSLPNGAPLYGKEVFARNVFDCCTITATEFRMRVRLKAFRFGWTVENENSLQWILSFYRSSCMYSLAVIVDADVGCGLFLLHWVAGIHICSRAAPMSKVAAHTCAIHNRIKWCGASVCVCVFQLSAMRRRGKRMNGMILGAKTHRWRERRQQQKKIDATEDGFEHHWTEIMSFNWRPSDTASTAEKKEEANIYGDMSWAEQCLMCVVALWRLYSLYEYMSHARIARQSVRKRVSCK